MQKLKGCKYFANALHFFAFIISFLHILNMPDFQMFCFIPMCSFLKVYKFKIFILLLKILVDGRGTFKFFSDFYQSVVTSFLWHFLPWTVHFAFCSSGKSSICYWLPVQACHLPFLCFSKAFPAKCHRSSLTAHLKWIIISGFVSRFHCLHRRMVRHYRGFLPLEAAIYYCGWSFCFRLSLIKNGAP